MTRPGWMDKGRAMLNKLKPARPAAPIAPPTMKKGGVVKKMAKGGMVRGNGCAKRGFGKLSKNG